MLHGPGEYVQNADIVVSMARQVHQYMEEFDGLKLVPLSESMPPWLQQVQLWTETHVLDASRTPSENVLSALASQSSLGASGSYVTGSAVSLDAAQSKGADGHQQNWFADDNDVMAGLDHVQKRKHQTRSKLASLLT